MQGTFFVIKKAYKNLVNASVESDNPKDFWEMVNELRQKSADQISDKIDAEEWFT